MRVVRPIAAAVLGVVLLAAPAAAQERVVDVDTLESSPQEYSCVGTEICPTVVLEGELVGDYGTRRDGSIWVQLNDDAYARSPIREGGGLAGGNRGIGLHGSAALFEGLGEPGRYEWRGPLVRVTGEFRYHDPERDGETYVEVESLELLEASRPTTEAFRPWVVAVGGLLLAAAAAAGALKRRRTVSRRLARDGRLSP